ncbi:MAG: zinc ribbon domain-containing protein [Candidatus Thorarchaeota archaeon]
MRRPERLIIGGMFLVFIGILLLTLSTSPTSSGFFFIFPFIFVGELSSPMLALVLVSVAIVFFILFLGTSRLLSPTWTQIGDVDREVYVRLSSRCKVCGSPIPESAVFCPSCGSTLGDGSSENGTG